ncbi:MAG: peptide chain release factor N(5)-glutamine methyltransferase, partial [Mariprofundaceae bacterium]|nr:peptide chain release factor N(5)-glutamine methyltransferase [Mariprofundaceae bacterium]
MTPRRLLRQAIETLQNSGCASPKLDAELLLCHVLGKGRSWLIAHADDALSNEEVAGFTDLLARRSKREPVAYITGEKEFWSRSFHVSPQALIPRPETEHLIEAVLTHFPDQQAVYHFCDIGTGSGIIAITLACEYPQARITATDTSHEALDIARGNAQRYQVSERISFLQGDLLGALTPASPNFDAIISNPPYVARHEMDALEAELGFEPRSALTDESDGLEHLRKLVSGAPAHLKKNGLLMVETGLCGLPAGTETLPLKEHITDLAGKLRGGIYGPKTPPLKPRSL